MLSNLRLYPTPLMAARALADYLIDVSNLAIGARGRFMLALSGGRTPRVLFDLLASADYLEHLDWEHFRIFWVDERCVPPEHPDSNYGMTRMTLLNYVRIPVSQIYRMRGELPPEDAAAAYERDLREAFARRDEALFVPRFDMLLLGVGTDGHISSLFPGSDALAETERWVQVTSAPSGQARISLTLPVLNAANEAAFLVTGEDKIEILGRLHNPPPDAEPLPVEMLQIPAPRVRWYCDEAAGRRLRSTTP